MNPMHKNRQEPIPRAFTFIELLIVIVLVTIVCGLFVPANTGRRTKATRIQCVNNLKQVALAQCLYADDSNGLFPWNATNRTGRLLFSNVTTAADWYRFTSNYLNSPKILCCPTDDRQCAADFKTLTDKNISYFINLDSRTNFSDTFLAGDRNILSDGIPIASGRIAMKQTETLSWSKTMHKEAGNIALSDGSVQELTSSGLQTLWTSQPTSKVAVSTNAPITLILP
jgi:prepilin-type N-terminal cleavage/methylation domain-containing protein